jgi:ER-bound oxygenase mpaB/B'/Rubber oxygenase, catalytic domain
VKCSVNRGWAVSQRLTAGVLWVEAPIVRKDARNSLARCRACKDPITLICIGDPVKVRVQWSFPVVGLVRTHRHRPRLGRLAKVEHGAEVFRRYGSELYPYFGIMTFNAYGLEIIATPLAMTGAYTGGSAFGRFLETSRLWTDTTEPGAMRPGGVGRRSAIMVRVLHSISRHTMLPQAKWDRDRLGMPISQFGMLGTLLLSLFAPVNS